MSCDDAMTILRKGRGNHFDAELLDAFEGIAPEWFETFANQEGDGPREALPVIVDRYFGREVETTRG